MKAVKEASCSTPPIPPYTETLNISTFNALPQEGNSCLYYFAMFDMLFDRVKLFAKPHGLLANDGRRSDLHFPVNDWISISEGPI